MQPHSYIPEYPSYNILDYAQCNSCPKRESRSAVFIEHWPPGFRGDANTKHIMLVGEYPSKSEMRAQRPFVSPGGAVVREAVVTTLQKYSTNVRLLLTNVVKCSCVTRPEVEAIRACEKALAKEADLFAPHLIIGFGRTAFHTLTYKGHLHFLTDNRGKKFEYRGWPVRVTYHPNAVKKHMNYRICLYQDLNKYFAELFKKQENE